MRRVLAWLFFAGVMATLGYSVVRSGVNYQLDIDEFFHAQYVYLVASGSIPFAYFNVSVYTPLFAWFLLPLGNWLGYTFRVLVAARWLMVMLFAVRIFLSVIFIRRVFGKTIGWLFLLLFLLDPFTVFAAMQIRPDNLMMLLYTAGLLSLSWAIDRPSVKKFFLTGLFMGIASLVLMKIVPLTVTVTTLMAFYLLKKKRLNCLLSYLIGILVPVLLFAWYGVFTGSLPELVQQLVLDAVLAFSAFRYPVPLGNFYRPDNIYIYGTMGRPMTWIYAWILLYMAFAGAYHTLISLFKQGLWRPETVIKLIAVVTLVVYQGLLFFLPSVFIQYYLPLGWLYALFAAIALVELFKILPRSSLWRGGYLLAVAGFLLTVVYSSVKANLARAQMTWREQQRAIEKRWENIGGEQTVFPGYLFRPLAHPCMYCYFLYVADVPQVIKNRYPSIEQVLETKQVPYVLLSSYSLGLLPAETQAYINTYYRRTTADEELYLRFP